MQAKITATGRLVRMRIRKEMREEANMNRAFSYMHSVNQSILRDPTLRREGPNLKGWGIVIGLAVLVIAVVIPAMAASS